MVPIRAQVMNDNGKENILQPGIHISSLLIIVRKKVSESIDRFGVAVYIEEREN